MAKKKTSVKKKSTPGKKKASSSKSKSAKPAAKKAKPAAQKKVAKKSAAKKSITAKAAGKKKVVAKKASAKTSTKKKTAKKSTTKTKASKAAAETPVKKKSSGRLVQGNNGSSRRRKKVTSVSSLKGYNKYVSGTNVADVGLTDAQLRKIDSGLSRAEISHYRRVLLNKRSEILGDVQLLEIDALPEQSNGISYEHMADAGSDNFEQEFNLELMEADRRMLERINDALERIANGTYGVCVDTGVPIGKERLDAKPWAKWIITVARDKERLGKL